jgi:hypothetical protein
MCVACRRRSESARKRGRALSPSSSVGRCSPLTVTARPVTLAVATKDRNFVSICGVESDDSHDSGARNRVFKAGEVHMSTQTRVLRRPVEVLESALPLTKAEHATMQDLVTRGLPAEQAERIVRRLRERRFIPAGTTVEVFPHSGGDGGPDDAPALLVRSPDGLIGLTRLYNLTTSAPPKRKPRRVRETVSLWRYEQ